MSKPREFWIARKAKCWTNVYKCNIYNALDEEPKDTSCFHVIEKQAADKLAEALKKCKGAMKYAYEDHADQFYLNHLNDIEQALKEYRGEE